MQNILTVLTGYLGKISLRDLGLLILLRLD